MSVKKKSKFVVQVRRRAENPRGLVAGDEFLQKVAAVAGRRTAFRLPCESGKSLRVLITAGGYEYVDPAITSCLVDGSFGSETDVALVHLDEEVSTVAAFQLLNACGLWPVGLLHLLRFRLAYPEEWKKYPIIALGDQLPMPRGTHGVPCLDTLNGRKPVLRLYWAEDGWRREHRFLVISKPA